MLIPHRRNPSRRRQAPKRYEDETFVSGRIDQYTRGYEGRDSNWKAAAEDAAKKAMDAGMRSISVLVKGPGSGRESAVRALATAGLKVNLLRDITPIPHNGCRPPKRRRV